MIPHGRPKGEDPSALHEATPPPNTLPAARERVLAVLDDASAASPVIDASTALAQLLHRELQVVYVESAAALAAAELPVTQVLAHTLHQWGPFARADVERGWRVHAARLRTMAELASLRREVTWSMRITRGALHQTAFELQRESDMLLVATASIGFPLAVTGAPHRLIAVFDDGGPLGRQAVQIATPLAHKLAARLQRYRVDAGSADALPAVQADLVIVPGGLLAPRALATLRVPILLVGAPAPTGA